MQSTKTVLALPANYIGMSCFILTYQTCTAWSNSNSALSSTSSNPRRQGLRWTRRSGHVTNGTGDTVGISGAADAPASERDPVAWHMAGQGKRQDAA